MKKVIGKFWHWEFFKLFFFGFTIIGFSLVFLAVPSLFPSAFASVILFFVFCPTIDSLERKGVSRTISITLLFLMLGGLLSIAASYVIPQAAKEMQSFESGSQEFLTKIHFKLKTRESEWIKDSQLFKAVFKDYDLTSKFLNWMGDFFEKLLFNAPNFASQVLVALFMVPIFTFVLLKDSRKFRRHLMRLVPNRYFETSYSLTSRILDKMGGYVAARILEAALVMMFVVIGCLIAKIPYAVMIGFFAGATNPIPYLGPLLGALPGIALAILDPTNHAQLFWMLVIYGVTNLLDTILIFPLLVAKIVDIHPVIVVISVFLGAQIFGMIGMLMAVPFIAILKILIGELYTKIYESTETIQ